jgi:APA family basic amino acid/polyamine antiporter
MSLWRKKSITKLLADAENNEHGLKKTLTATSLVALGIGAIIGAGLFVRTAAAASEHAGNAVTISFLIAAVGCLFAGLCYAEFASMIPIAGSAYTYAYTTMGELVAWIIGWALVLEYALGAATVSIAWSEYLNKLLGGAIPYSLCHSPFEAVSAAGEHGIINLPALLILLILSLLLIKGTAESAKVNTIIVFVKVSIVLVFIAVGWHFIVPANHTPYIIPDDAKPVDLGNGKIFDYAGSARSHGWGGILSGAAVVFFAFIGFDAVSTAAQETKNPKRDMPIGILGSLAVCTVLYILFAHVLTGVAPFTDFLKAGKEASVSYAIDSYMHMHWLATLVTVAILAGFSSVILVMLLGQSRVFYSMSNDGLLPKVFSDLHPKFRTPYKSNIILFLFVGFFGAFIPESVAGDLTSIGTLLAFILVCLGIIIMRKADPDRARPFRTPFVPVVPILGILVCGAMVCSEDPVTIVTALCWMVFGLIIFFAYSRHHSNIGKENLPNS